MNKVVVTKESIVEAFRTTGLKPVRFQIQSRNEGRDCGCAIGALAFAHGHNRNIGASQVGARMGLNPEEVASICHGWDLATTPGFYPELYREARSAALELLGTTPPAIRTSGPGPGQQGGDAT